MQSIRSIGTVGMAKRSRIDQIPLSPASAVRIVRRLATNAENVYFVRHAEVRMQQRRISQAQVMACLLRGSIHEGPALDIHGCWRFTMHRSVAGDMLNVTASLTWDAQSATHVLVITVFGD